jgi:hypothetical protein
MFMLMGTQNSDGVLMKKLLGKLPPRLLRGKCMGNIQNARKQILRMGHKLPQGFVQCWALTLAVLNLLVLIPRSWSV